MSRFIAGKGRNTRQNSELISERRRVPFMDDICQRVELMRNLLVKFIVKAKIAHDMQY